MTLPRLRRFLLASLLLVPLPAVAQSSGGTDDTRLRLDRDLDRRGRATDARLSEEADALAAPPNSLEIDGTTYSVANNANDMGQALYISIQRRQWPDARRFLGAYRRLPDHDPMLVLYAEGGLARMEGKLGAAERSYAALVARQPDFLPGRLELARVLFENRKDREARRAFEAVRTTLSHEGTKADGVVRTVDAFLVALRRRQAWQGSLSLGPGYSNNLNQSSASYTCLLAADDGACLFDRKVPDAIRAVSVNFEGALNRRLSIGGNGGIKMRALAFGEVYPGAHDYSQTTATLRLGYDRQTARDGLFLAPSFEAGSLGSTLLYTAWGANMEWLHNFSPRAAVKLEGSWRDLRYAMRPYRVFDGALGQASITGWYGLAGGWMLLGGPDFVDKRADNPINAYRQIGGRVGISKAFGNWLSLFAIASFRDRQYRGYSATLEAQRHDRERNYTAVLGIPALRFAGLVPTLTVQQSRVKSNIDWLYSYRKTALSLRLTYAF